MCLRGFYFLIMFMICRVATEDQTAIKFDDVAAQLDIESSFDSGSPTAMPSLRGSGYGRRTRLPSGVGRRERLAASKVLSMLRCVPVDALDAAFGGSEHVHVSDLKEALAAAGVQVSDSDARELARRTSRGDKYVNVNQLKALVQTPVVGTVPHYSSVTSSSTLRKVRARPW